MEPEHLTELRQKLLEIRASLSERGPMTVEPGRRLPIEKPDEDEQPYVEMSQVIASNRNKAHQGSLRAVEAALRRIEHEPEDYGLCLECEEPIALGRLRLIPYAELCVACQSAQEEPTTGRGRRHITDYT